MTRLIDVDALYTLFVKMKSFGELTAKKAIRCVEKAPTVEAIPVEWLENFRDGLDTLSESRLMLAIDLIIDAYRAERKRKEEWAG